MWFPCRTINNMPSLKQSFTYAIAYDRYVLYWIISPTKYDGHSVCVEILDIMPHLNKIYRRLKLPFWSRLQ